MIYKMNHRLYTALRVGTKEHKGMTDVEILIYLQMGFNLLNITAFIVKN